MPTDSEQRVLLALDKHNGNAKAVADDLVMSESYIYRVKRELWKQGQTTALVATQQEERGLDLIKSLLPPNIQAVGKLRDDTIANLNKDLPQLPAKVKVYLLNAILRYETALRTSIAPSIQVLQDNRSNITVNNLVDRLAGASIQDLRAMAGVSDDIVEGEFTA